jgi:peptidoglycan/LPS O-acetylase OafA/YrhL
LQWLGQISYGLYLYHFPILLISLDIARGLGLTGKLYAFRILAILITVPIAGLSWRFIERPLLELKRRYSYIRVPVRLRMKARGKQIRRDFKQGNQPNSGSLRP